MASFVSSVDSCSINGTWIVNSGSTSHMTGTYNAFQSIMEIEPGHFVDTGMNLPQVAVRGFGTVRFQLECGEFLQVDSVLFVPGLRISRLSVSALEDGGLGTLVMFGCLFIYHMHDP